MTLLRTHHLAIGYDRHTIGHHIDLNIECGTLICLLGTNGCGKSTLLRTLAGLQPALDGDIHINDRPIGTFTPDRLARQLAVVLTERPDNTHLSVHDIVALGRYPYTGRLGALTDADHQAINLALQHVNLEHYAQRKVNTLSDGEAQRTMIARALAQDTPLILLDEPTSHLDLPNRINIMMLLHHIARTEQKAIVMSTHELDLALQMADHLWLFNESGSIRQGSSRQLTANGDIERVFASDTYHFDINTGRIVIHQTPS